MYQTGGKKWVCWKENTHKKEKNLNHVCWKEKKRKKHTRKKRIWTWWKFFTSKEGTEFEAHKKFGLNCCCLFVLAGNKIWILWKVCITFLQRNRKFGLQFYKGTGSLACSFTKEQEVWLAVLAKEQEVWLAVSAKEQAVRRHCGAVLLMCPVLWDSFALLISGMCLYIILCRE